MNFLYSLYIFSSGSPYFSGLNLCSFNKSKILLFLSVSIEPAASWAVFALGSRE